jgi:cell division protein FtsL
MTESPDEESLKNVIRIFFIMIGVCLFFFFLVLIPFFSLRLDSTAIQQINAKFNATNMISSLDRYINESKDLESAYHSLTAEQNDSKIQRDIYNNTLDKIKFLHNNANVTVDNPLMQNTLADLQVYSACNTETFATDKWSKCNYDHKASEINNDMLSKIKEDIKRVKDLNSGINETKYKILSMTKPLLKIVKADNSYVPFIKIDGSIISDSSLKELVVRMRNATQSIESILSLHTNTNLTNGVQISGLRDDIGGIKNGLEERATEINNKLQKVSAMFENFETPVGTIPIGFQELVALFPFIISILFLFFAYSLSDGMKSKQISDKKGSFAASLLFNPNQKVKTQKLQIALLLIPIFIFVSSLIVTMLIDFVYDQASLDSDDPFRAAVDLNKLIYVVMSVLASIFMVIGLRRLFFVSN